MYHFRAGDVASQHFSGRTIATSGELEMRAKPRKADQYYSVTKALTAEDTQDNLDRLPKLAGRISHEMAHLQFWSEACDTVVLEHFAFENARQAMRRHGLPPRRRRRNSLAPSTPERAS